MAGEVDICVGTLSKAFGCHGGFAALSAASKQLLLNRGRSYVYSTALPVPIVAGALAALRVATQQVRIWGRPIAHAPCCAVCRCFTRRPSGPQTGCLLHAVAGTCLGGRLLWCSNSAGLFLRLSAPVRDAHAMLGCCRSRALHATTPHIFSQEHDSCSRAFAQLKPVTYYLVLTRAPNGAAGALAAGASG